MANVQYYDVILKPVVTEKSMNAMAEKKYTFLVHPDANKTMIKEAVERMFEGTKVAKVNTMNCEGKNKRRGMVTGKTEDKEGYRTAYSRQQRYRDLRRTVDRKQLQNDMRQKRRDNENISKGETKWELRHITHIHLPEEI